jgi:hypothetical protein
MITKIDESVEAFLNGPDVDFTASNVDDRREFLCAYRALLQRAVCNWHGCYNEETGAVSVPITDWDRAEHPILGVATHFRFDVSSFRLIGSNRSAPPGMKHRDTLAGETLTHVHKPRDTEEATIPRMRR